MTAQPANEKELVLDRLIDAPREKVFRCWTDPELVTQWFAPKPWTTPRADLDVRPGGSCTVVMADPEGNEYPNVIRHGILTPVWGLSASNIDPLC